MNSRQYWLDQFCTLLLERERSLKNWLQFVQDTIPSHRRKSLQTLIKEFCQKTKNLSLLEKNTLIAFFSNSERFQKWWNSNPCPLPLPFHIHQPYSHLKAACSPLPSLPNLTSLAKFLNLRHDDLNWLLSPRHHHYHEQWLPKRKGGRRLLESPKPLLKQCQQTILKNLLNHLPPHEVATGFRVGHSILDFVQPHTQKPLVLKMDLKDFFPSLGRRRIKRLFMSLGYRESVAYALSSLTTTRSHRRDFHTSEQRLYQSFHLPQGAPTSPALANLGAFRFDCRLAAWARATETVYTRYADDLLFSGEKNLNRIIKKFETKVIIIAWEEGFTINPRKTRLMPQSQRQTAAGLILNEGLNGRRKDYDLLKAILYNCQKYGPQSQNHNHHPHFREHLTGRIHWLASLNTRWGQKLHTAFTHIDWT